MDVETSLRFADEGLIEYLAKQAVAPRVSAERGRLSFAHDSLGDTLAAFAVTAAHGISLRRTRPLDEHALQALVPKLDEALDEHLRPDFCAVALSVAADGPVVPEVKPWLTLFEGKLLMRLRGELYAMPHFREAYAQIGDLGRRAWLGLMLGIAEVSHGTDAEAALAYLHESERLYRQMGDLDRALHARVMQLAAYSRLGRFATKSRELDPKSLVSRNRSLSAERLLRLGILYRQNGFRSQAVHTLEQSYALRLGTGETIALAETSIALGDILRSLHRWREAEERYLAALGHLEEAAEEGYPSSYALRFHRASALLGLCRAVLFGSRNIGVAEHAIRESLRTFDELNIRHHRAVAWSAVAQIAEMDGRSAEAIIAYRRSAELYEFGKDWLLAAQQVGRLARLHIRLGHPVSAAAAILGLIQIVWQGRSQLPRLRQYLLPRR